MGKRILLINDQPSYGKVALAAMVPILSSMKHDLFCLPTALVSNTLDYKKFFIQETTDYMKESLAAWEALGFTYDAVCTGFLVSKPQTELVISICKDLAAQGKPVFCDPIMGDDGHLYNGVGPETVDLMRELASCADYIVPNYTEAAAMANVPYKAEGMTWPEACQLVDALRDMGAKSVIVTSAILTDEDFRHCVVGYDHHTGEYFRRAFSEVPMRFPGTGDIYSAVFTGKVMAGMGVQEANAIAMQAVRNMIVASNKMTGDYTGIPVEAFLNCIPDSVEEAAVEETAVEETAVEGAAAEPAVAVAEPVANAAEPAAAEPAAAGADAREA